MDAAEVETASEAPAAPTPAPAPAPGRTRLAGHNAASSLIYSVVTLGVGLAATPMLLRFLGKEGLGAARTATDLYGWLTLLELGLGGTLGPLLAGSLARGDDRRMHHTMAAGTRAYLLLTLPVLAVGSALVATGLLDRLIPVAASLRVDLHRAWFVGLIGWMTLAMIPMRALLEAGQRSYRINFLLTMQAVLVQVAAVALAYAGGGITGQMAAMAAGTILVALAIARAACTRHPGLLREIWTTRPDPEVRRAIWGLSGPTLIFNISGRIAILSDSIIISAVLGDQSLVLWFFLTQRLALLAQGQLQGIGNASWAALAELHARGERALFNRRLVELTGLVAVLGVAALAPIFAFNGDFLRIWLKAQAPATGVGDLLIGLAAINALLVSVFSLWGWCFGGTGRVRRIVVPSAAAAVLNLVASIALTATLGLIGPLLGTTIAILTVTAWTSPLRLRQDFGTSIPALVRAVLVPVALGVPYAFALRWASRAYPPQGWVTLAAMMGCSALAFLLLAGRFLLSPADRHLWLDRLGKVLGRSR